jgi:prepilin-type N-terminal cleavage/methylation domain-containing protein
MLRKIKGFTLIELLIVIAIILILIAIALPNFLEAQIRARVTKANGEMRSLATALFDYNTALISASKEGIFPPAGNVAQNGWTAWSNTATGMSPNVAGNNLHACSIIWVSGSFYAKKDDSTAAAAQTSGPAPNISIHYDLRVMTSPIESITSVPLDPFKNDGGFNAQYDYFGLNLRDTFVLRSLGPDGIAQVGCEAEGFFCACTRGTDCLASGDDEKDGPTLHQNVTNLTGNFCDGAGCRGISEALRVGKCVYSPTNGTKSAGDLWRFQQ